jgi:hypothetical protein
MTVTTVPPKQEVETASFEQALSGVWNSVEDLLGEMPRSRLEARRLITRELRFEPRPEELQAIVSMAEERTDKGLRRELPRSMLSLRVLAERELSVLLGENRLEAARLEQSAALLPKIEREVQRLEAKLRSSTETMAGMTVEDRDYLLYIGKALRCPDDAIRVAMLLAPRLAQFLKLASAEDPPAGACGLSERELELIWDAVREPDEPGPQPSRICINALAVRSIMEEDLRTRAGRERLQADNRAYQFVCERLQKQQDMALIAGLTGFADEMWEVARSLFAVNLKLLDALRDGARPEEEAEGIAHRKLSREEVILKAINDTEGEAGKPQSKVTWASIWRRMKARLH